MRSWLKTGVCLLCADIGWSVSVQVTWCRTGRPCFPETQTTRREEEAATRSRHILILQQRPSEEEEREEYYIKKDAYFPPPSLPLREDYRIHGVREKKTNAFDVVAVKTRRADINKVSAPTVPLCG